MNTDDKLYRIIITENAKQHIRKIYSYISQNLMAERASKRLMNKLEKTILNLKHFPKIYKKIEKRNLIQKEYRRMVINNFIVLYFINEEKHIIYITHMFYGGSNYINKI